jgi:hypothetical protein
LRLFPADTRLLVLTAAAEPVGDPVLFHRAAATLDLDLAAASPAVDAGLLKVGGRVEFAHPLVRSAAYRAATADDRYRVHRALAEATDPEADPIGGPGTWPKRRRDLARRSRPSSSVRPAGPRRAVASPPRRRSGSGRWR